MASSLTEPGRPVMADAITRFHDPAGRHDVELVDLDRIRYGE